MKINLERLIGAVQEYFYDREQYAKESKKKPQWQRSAEEQKRVIYYFDCENAGWRVVYELYNILNLDSNKLIAIARLARKWEQKHNWEKCFPVQEHEQKILDYLTADNKYPRTEREYLHWYINRKAEKAAEKAA